MPRIADQLRQAIKRSGKSRYRVSLDSGISEAVLSRFVSGKSDLTLANTDKLCKALGLRVVLEPEGKPRPKKPKR